VARGSHVCRPRELPQYFLKNGPFDVSGALFKNLWLPDAIFELEIHQNAFAAPPGQLIAFFQTPYSSS